MKSSRAAHDFLREWKTHNSNAKDTLSFLTSMDNENRFCLDPDAFCKDYFAADIDSEVLGDIIEALHLLITLDDMSQTEQLLLDEDAIFPFIHGWLKALKSCGRFELSVSFLTKDQQLKLTKVCAFLSNSNR